MVFVNDGKNCVRDWLGGQVVGSPSHMAIGSSSTTAYSTDTALGSEINRTRRIFDSITRTDKYVELEMILPSTEPSGLMPITMREVGVFNGSPTGSMFTRRTFAGIEKNENIEYQTILSLKIL